MNRTAAHRWILALLLALAVLAAACDADAGGDDEAADDEAPADEGDEAEDAGLDDVPEDTIVLADSSWESLWIINAVAETIISDGYGYDVHIAQVSTPIMQQSILQGDVHIMTEMWCINFQAWCAEHESAGDVVLTDSMFDEAVQGWYVPTYVIEGDPERDIEPVAPDLESVEDLLDHPDVFADPEDPERGVLYSGIQGWDVAEINQIRASAYGLDEVYNAQIAGSPAAMDAAISGAFDRGEPIVFYYWAPSWVVGQYDVTLLDEPEWDSDCQDATEELVAAGQTDAGEDAACAFPGGPIPSALYPGLEDIAPDVVAFIEAMHIGDDPINEAQAHMETEGVEPEEAALWYFANYDDWQDWIAEDDVLERVIDALEEQGVDA